MKQTMIQYFQWYTRADGFQYTRLKRQVAPLAKLGYSLVWMPSAYKGSSGKKDNGYAPYDLYDVGEFMQKGSVRTKYGNVRQYQAAIEACHKAGLSVIADIVFNHRMGGDEPETVRVVDVDWNDRCRILSKPYETELYTRYTFPGRKGKYSPFIWNQSCFKAADRISRKDHTILLFDGKKWSDNVSKELGNFDYIMGMDVDVSVDWVRQELIDWGLWYTRRFEINGYRLDAIKSIEATFFPAWLYAMRSQTNASPFAVGEYWSASLEELKAYLRQARYSMRLFDVPLHYNLHHASMSNGNYDVRHLMDGTLSKDMPDYAVAFVDNHDTQPTQALESWVMDWFKTSAYALILLGTCQVPCVFLGDVQGISKTKNPRVSLLNEMVWIRSNLLEGDYQDLCDEDRQKACWITHGCHPVLILFTIGDGKTKSVHFEQYAGCRFTDISRADHIVAINENGDGMFDCAAGCCSIYILEQDAEAMERALSSIRL